METMQNVRKGKKKKKKEKKICLKRVALQIRTRPLETKSIKLTLSVQQFPALLPLPPTGTHRIASVFARGVVMSTQGFPNEQ